MLLKDHNERPSAKDILGEEWLMGGVKEREGSDLDYFYDMGFDSVKKEI